MNGRYLNGRSTQLSWNRKGMWIEVDVKKHNFTSPEKESFLLVSYPQVNCNQIIDYIII
jgi:hypothetical protein